jgi:hypothetical protein
MLMGLGGNGSGKLLRPRNGRYIAGPANMGRAIQATASCRDKSAKLETTQKAGQPKSIPWSAGQWLQSAIMSTMAADTDMVTFMSLARTADAPKLNAARRAKSTTKSCLAGRCFMAPNGGTSNQHRQVSGGPCDVRAHQ